MVDWYTKLILTIIAIALIALAVQPYIMPNQARAQWTSGDTIDVRIRGIDEARHLRWEPLPVRIVR